MKYIKLFIFIALIIVTTSCNQQNGTNKLQSGTWLGELEVAENKKVPFLFEVSNTTADSSTVTLINGEDRFDLEGQHLTMTRNNSYLYDAVIKGTITDNQIDGKFIKTISKLIREYHLGQHMS